MVVLNIEEVFISKAHLKNFGLTDYGLIVARLSTLAYKYMEKDKELQKESVTIFLSHKHSEVEILKKVIDLLEKVGVNVYVDWKDEEMPRTTSGKTAAKIKEKIIENEKFILLATKDAINSKWCNWELGFGDSHKFSKDIAIMPIVENDGSWPGNEYLQIYPVIKTHYQYTTGNYYVEFENEIIPLEQWLKR